MPERSGQNWKNTIRGNPGAVWTNTGAKVLYQWHCNFANSCGRCIEMANCIGPWWPLPLHHGCTCKNVPIRPGQSAAAFVDYREEIRRLDPDQQRRVIGASNLRLVEAGVVPWEDIVQRGRIKTLEEVVSEKRLTVDGMVKAGVSRGRAERAFERVNTPDHLLVEAKRKELVEKLKAGGLTAEEIRKRAAEGLAGRIGIGGGPSGPQTPPRVQPPPPPPVPPAAPPLPPPPGPPPKPVGSLANFVVPATPTPTLAPTGAMPTAKIDWEAKGWRDAIKEVEDSGGREIRERVLAIARKAEAAAEKIRAEKTGVKLTRAFLDLQHKTAMTIAKEIRPGDQSWKIRRNDAAAVSTFSVGGEEVKPPGSYLKRQVEKAEEFVGGLLGPEHRPAELAIGYGQTVSHEFRAYHSGTSQFGSISVSFQASTPTVIHEIGHAIEMQTPGLVRAAESYRQHRVGGETPTRLKEAFPEYGFSDSEFGAKDEFGKVWDGVQAYYAGKGYNGKATELISMGIERLYQDAGSIAQNDPDLFYFLVGAIRGRW